MTSLGNRATYYIVTGTSTGNRPDAKGYFKLYYEYEPTNLRYKVNVECYLRRYPYYDGSDYYIVATTGNIRPTVNGNTGSQISFNKSGYQTSNSGDTTELISTQTFSVPINLSDGTASVSFSGRFYGSVIGISNTRTCSYTWDLPTVPVTTTITNDTSESSKIEFGNTVTFTITPPQNSNFTHTLSYEVNETTYTIVSETSQSSVPYTFPTTLIDNFTDTSQPSIIVTCLSSNGTTSSTTVYLQIPDTDTYRPTVSISLADAMSNKPQALDGLWIKNKSLLQGTIDGTPKNNATIISYQADISGFNETYSGEPNPSTGTFTFTTQALTIADNRTITYQAKDSRGLTKVNTQNIYVINYENPNISSAKVERCDANGNLDESGSYGKVTVTYKVSPITDNNVNKNIKTLTVRKNNDAEQTIPTTANVYQETVSAWFDFSLTETTTATFYITLTDIFGSVPPYEYPLGVAYKTVSKRAGGKGIAFGKVATQDGFDCDMDAVFRKTITGNLTGTATGIENRSFISPNSSTYIQGNDDDIPTKKAIENWNGAYNSSNDSNLEYCKNGKLGAIVTSEGYSTDTFTCTKTSGGATITSSTFDKFGKVVTVYIVFTVQTATSAGNNAWEGTVTDLPLPTGVVTASAFIGNQPYSLNIDTSGNMIIRALTTTLAVSTNNHNISVTYITNS